MSTISQLHLPFEFTYEYFLENRYKISESKNYEALCNNGFIKLYTPNGRVYWHVQNEFSHQTPDWKFHVSVKHQQLPQAWNLIAGIFTTMKCRSGMKTYYLKECTEPQPGREITVYILRYQDEYRKSVFANDFQLSRADQHSEQFWYEFVKNVEETLESHGIQSNGLAPGDYRIGKYVSLRNQAFVKGQKGGEYIYPPNQFGWNPLKHEIPLNLQKIQDYLNCDEEENKSLRNKLQKNKSFFVSFMIPFAVVSIMYLTTKTKVK